MSSQYDKALTRGYGFARVRDAAFDAVRELWRTRQHEGMSQKDVALRLNRDAAWVSRKLSGPTNWTLKTFGDLLDALDGEVEIIVHDLRSDQRLQNYDAYEEIIERGSRSKDYRFQKSFSNSASTTRYAQSIGIQGQ